MLARLFGVALAPFGRLDIVAAAWCLPSRVMALAPPFTDSTQSLRYGVCLVVECGFGALDRLDTVAAVWRLPVLPSIWGKRGRQTAYEPRMKGMLERDVVCGLCHNDLHGGKLLLDPTVKFVTELLSRSGRCMCIYEVGDDTPSNDGLPFALAFFSWSTRMLSYNEPSLHQKARALYSSMAFAQRLFWEVGIDVGSSTDGCIEEFRVV